MKNTGIWIDKKKAIIVNLVGESVRTKTVESDVEFYHPKGGARAKTRWGPQDVVQDSKYTERENTQLKRYFKELVGKLSKDADLALFGPADTAEKLKKYIEANHPEKASRIKTVAKSDSMTENQFIARVKEYYGQASDRFRQP